MSGIYRGPNGSATADALNIDGDKGDLTISNSGLDWTINPDTVDFSKMQNISTDTILGRATAGTGDVEEITCTAAGRALLDDTNASAQRTTLGLGNAATATIGTEVLAYDANLQSFVNTFTLPTSDATNGFVLTTNGSGTLSLTAPGGIADADYGDISVSTGGTVWTIDNDVVSYAKIQNVSATDKLLGRSTAGAGDIEEITCTSAGRALLDDGDASAQRTTLGLGSLATLNSITNAELDNQYIDDLTIVTFDSDTDYVAIADGSDSGNKKKALLPKVTNKIYDIDASVAGNDLTITVNSGVWDFRSTTLTDGTPVTRTLSSPVSLVIPNGATLGSVNAIASRYIVGLLDNTGTLEPFAINIAGGNQLDETNLITTTSISTSADSNNVAYSATGRSNLAYRIIGFIDITEATAGVYATAPTLVQGCGGQALSALSSFGYGQTEQNLTGSRALATTYYNTTGKPIKVIVSLTSTSAGQIASEATLNGLALGQQLVQVGGAGFKITEKFEVGAGKGYSIATTASSTTPTLNSWVEIR